MANHDLTPGAAAFDSAVQRVRGGGDLHIEAKRLFDCLDEDERLGLLDGDTPFWAGLGEIGARYNARPYVHGAVERLGIPGTRFIDGPRGCVTGSGTAFPVPMARGATWDPSLEEKIGDVIGREVRAQGGNFFGGVCINLPRHPAWGRAQETYGDDPYHLGEFGAALTRGVQPHVMACAKHYALNSMENARFTVDVQIAEADLHDIYLPHFKRTADEGVCAMMSAYNAVNGAYAGQNKYLLTQVLRDDWGWSGITVSDFVFGLRDAAKSLEAGLDIEEPFAQIRATHLKRQLEAGETSWAAVERAGVRSLATQLRHYAARVEGDYGPETMVTDAARRLAHHVAARAMVLLKNEPVDGAPVLPLNKSEIKSIALIGRLADRANMGDMGSSLVRPPSHVTPYQGLQAAFPAATIHLVSMDDAEASAHAARDADIAIVVAGYDEIDEGEYVDPAGMASPELLSLFPPMSPAISAARSAAQSSEPRPAYGGDRKSLSLRSVDEDIIRAVTSANPRTVVAIVGSSAVLMEAWRHCAPAIVFMWYAGMEGGRALADVLSGAHNPSGRLPFSIPTSAAHLPTYDRDATQITYDRFHGQRLLDKLGVEPAFAHGFGLAYTTFEIREARVSAQSDVGLSLAVKVANTGDRRGRHVVQVYGRRTDLSDDDGFMLLGFAAAEVNGRESVAVDLEVSFLPLARWDASQRTRLMPASQDLRFEIGAYARDPNALHMTLADA